MKVFLGITGASGAPYAKGIPDGLVSAGAEVGVCASSAGIEVLATELYGDAGAVILFAAPGFYHGADTVQDLVDLVGSRCLDQHGIDNALVRRWGE